MDNLTRDIEFQFGPERNAAQDPPCLQIRNVDTS